MQIKINDNDEIIEFANYGGIEGSIEVDDKIVPNRFLEDFKSKYYLFKDGKIVVNEDYQEPTVDIPELSGPSPEMLAINALGIQLAKHLAGGD